MIIWITLEDVGGMNAVLPAAKLLQIGGKHQVTYFTKGKAAELAQNLLPPSSLVVCNQPATVAKNNAPEVILSSLCSSIGRDWARNLSGRRLTTIVAVQELWGARLRGEWAELRPDFMCVMDRADKAITQAAWPDFPAKNIIVTGNPAFDCYAHYDMATGKDRFERAMGLENGWPVLLFCVDYLEGGAQDLENLVAALDEIGEPINFIPRFHPDYKNRAQPGDPGKCQDALNSFTAGQIIDTGKMDLLDVIVGSTVVVGAWGTVQTTAAYLRRPVISVMFPELGQETFEKYVSKGFFPYPLTELGAAARANNQDELVELLRRALRQELDLEATQTAAFQPDGKAAERVARVVLGK